MNRVLKVALICGVAATMASCGTVRRALPFGLGRSDEAQATATEGQRISVLEFEQQHGLVLGGLFGLGHVLSDAADALRAPVRI